MNGKTPWVIILFAITIIFGAGRIIQVVSNQSEQIAKIESIQIEKRLTVIETSYVDIKKSLDRIESKIK